MRNRTNNFKTQIKEMGREIDSRITVDGMNNPILGEHIFTVSPILNTDILKSVMKGLNFESDIELDVGDRYKYEFGLLVGNDYEWLDYGYYYVFDKTYNEDTKHWTYTCYDKMLNSMVEYLGLSEPDFPTTVREYITDLLADINITFADANNTFTNYDKVITKDPYITDDENNPSLGYKYRDILDELSQVVAGNIMLDNSENAFIKYVNDTQDVINEEYFKDVDVEFKEKFGPLNTIILTRSGDADSIFKSNPRDLEEESRISLEIKDNQIMNGNDRADYAEEIIDKLVGLEFYTNDVKSTGIMYLEAMDLYNANITLEDEEGNITNNSYKCLMLNSEPTIEEGLEEKIFTEIPGTAKSNYSDMTGDDRLINQTYIIAKKNESEIEAFVGSDGPFNRLVIKVDGMEETLVDDHDDITEIKSSIEGLEVDVTKKGDNLVRNTMLWNYDGWLSNNFQPLAKGNIPPTDTNISYWYCTETSSNYENGVIYFYNSTSNKWEPTTLLKKDFYSSAGEQTGLSITEDKGNYLSGHKFNINYDGSNATKSTGFYSELFEISFTQESITFQFKLSTTITSGSFNVILDLFNNEYVSLLDADDYMVGRYVYHFDESKNFDKYELQIPLKRVINVVSGSSAPASTTNYWLDTTDTDAIVLKKYDTDTSTWITFENVTLAKDQNNKIYRFRVYNGVTYYEEWNSATTIKYGQVSLLPGGPENPNLSVEIGDIKVEYGVATDWSCRSDEVYSINHKMDFQGYTITKGDNKLFLDEDEMTGYYQNDKIFYINKNEVFSQISKSVISNVDGLITKKVVVGYDNYYVRYIE